MCHRLSELYYNINIDITHDIVFEQNNDGTLKVENLKLSLITGKTITNVSNLEIKSGSRWLIRGESGAGKTTFLKALAGVWVFGEGKIYLPKCKMMFLPQETYLPLGTLRTALCYPESADNFTDEICKDVLKKCGLQQYIENLDDDDITWSRKLSPGEKQRLAFAKCHLLRPGYLFLDEATSALDNQMEEMLYSQLIEDLPQVTIVSVAHRKTIDKFHNHIFTI
jgi:putative ATP-binding cassette transporter